MERCKRLLTQVCWETSAVCRDHLNTSYPPRLLELLFSCQLRYLAIYKVPDMDCCRVELITFSRSFTGSKIWRLS